MLSLFNQGISRKEFAGLSADSLFLGERRKGRKKQFSTTTDSLSATPTSSTLTSPEDSRRDEVVDSSAALHFVQEYNSFK
jgi:hypothetical protein